MAKNADDEEDKQATEQQGGEVVTLEEGDDNESDKGESDEHADDEGDERVRQDEGDEDREKIRAARREERKQRKEHKKKRDAERDAENIRLRRELDEINRRLSSTQQAVDSRFAQQDMGIVDQRLTEFKKARDTAKAALNTAVTKGDGIAASEAMDAHAEAVNAINALEAFKNAAKNQPAQTSQRAEIDPAVQRHTNEFKRRHPWFDMTTDTDDEDSQIVFAIDNAVRRAGFDPKNRDYWDELEDRLERRLPHRVADSDDDEEDEQPRQRQQRSSGRRGPSLGGSRNGERQLGKNEVYVPAELKKSMIESGAWYDPVKKKNIIKRYQEAIKRSNGAAR